MCCSWHPKSSGRLLHDWLVCTLPCQAAQEAFSLTPSWGMQSMKEVTCAVTGEVPATACYLKTNICFLSPLFMGMSFAHN